LVKFCQENSKEDPAQIMVRLKNNNPFKYESILSTQIMLCNSLARTKKVLYYAGSSLEGDELVETGICNREVQVGDDVVCISGVLQPLVVCDRRQEERAVEIVSPVDMGTGRKRYHLDVGGKMRRFSA
jgi:hypothetical protein